MGGSNAVTTARYFLKPLVITGLGDLRPINTIFMAPVWVEDGNAHQEAAIGHKRKFKSVAKVHQANPKEMAATAGQAVQVFVWKREATHYDRVLEPGDAGTVFLRLQLDSGKKGLN